ncbi:tRNA pseudouridine(65) synthase TruC [Paraglaciecola aquimarina]|uniref:tRNA pseudouridine synthase C n=1 Tax=Paraglaciecola aquimarina TaxID=1235557 RepID=A0ABU3T1J1_9ALTE|nr:tRNA pseudouridine(65) synthase TruC [Paraglaciecola aquimarina]MDU0356087.1 tRNA pseudouridine(65) synthase TruC [Paraglaciecola aquimarina]
MTELPIVYQDEYMVAINKPSGLLVHRSMLDKHETQFAMQMVRDQIGQHVFPVHRLDRPTSGVLVFALSADIARKLNEQFASQSISKTYLAVVRGHVPESGRIDYALKEKLDKIADKMAKQDKPAQQAVTEFSAMATFELPFAVGRYATARYSLVKLMPKTGRKHQLRRHMAHINHPIVGDTTHGDGKHNAFIRQQYALNQLALTCKSMSFVHPISDLPLTLSCELDNNLAELLEKWQLSHHQQQQINQL